MHFQNEANFQDFTLFQKSFGKIARYSCKQTQNDRLASTPVSHEAFSRSRWIVAQRTSPYWLLVRHPISERTGKWAVESYAGVNAQSQIARRT